MHRTRGARLRGRSHRFAHWRGRRPGPDVRVRDGELSGHPGSSHPESDERAADATLHGERRQVTVLFCDLVGSTELASRLDPEDLCQVMRHYQATCARALAPFGGYIAQTLGDGLLVYFGFPEAHEDDAARAVSAGIAAVQAVADEACALAGNWQRFAARVGIHTGLVYAGEVGHFDTRANRALVGDTPNIAARLQTIAARNEVLIGPTTRKLLRGPFQFESLGPRQLYGVPAPLEVFRVRRAPESATRFRARSRGRWTPLFGRARELAQLRERWQRARAGQGQLLLVAGAAGIGKSRLIEALRGEVSRDTMVLALQCSPYFQHTALHPVIAQLRRAASIRRRDSPEAKLSKLKRLLRDASPRAERNLGLLARLLQIPASIAPELDALSPQRLLDDTLEVLADRTLGLSLVHPLLVFLEDTHWSDPLTRRLVGQVAERIAHARAMVVITERSAHCELSRLNRVSVVRLKPLSHEDASQMIVHLTSGVRLGRHLRDEIVRRSEGIPLFIEELTQNVVEAADDEQAQQVPASLKDSLTARLDRLGAHRTIAQRAACLGDTFSYSMIEYVTGLQPRALDRGLRKLVEADWLSMQGDPPDARFTFRHALLQEAAYESTLLQERRAVHLAIAHKLERDSPSICTEQPELLARHYQSASSPRLAAEYWLRAGELAQGRSAHAGAIAHLGQGLQALAATAPSSERDALEIQLQSALARSHMGREGWAGKRLHAAYTRGRELSRALGQPRKECEMLWALCAHACVRGELSAASALAREYVALAEREQDRSALLMADSIALLAHYCLGEFDAAARHAQRVERAYRVNEDRHLARVYNQDPNVFALVYQSVWLWVQGDVDEAAAASARGIMLARSLHHPFVLCHALLNGSCVTLLRRDHAHAVSAIDEALALCEEERMPMFKAYAPLMGAPALFEREPTAATIEWFEQCCARMRGASAAIHMPLYLCHLAGAYDGLGATIEAEARIAEALEVCEATGERWCEAELLRVRARIALSADKSSDRGEMLLWSALDNARAARARSFELRVLCDLGELLERRGRRAEVQELVASAYALFEGQAATADSRRARAWLQRGGRS